MSAPSRCLVTVVIFTIIVVGILATASLIMGFLIALHSPSDADNEVRESDGVNPTMAPPTDDIEDGNQEEPMVPESEYADQKIWLIHVGEFNHRIAYLDDVTQQPMGFDVDVVNAVCHLSRKRCRIVFDSYGNCFGEGKIGVGLTDGYYHACADWGITYERLRSVVFTDAYQQSYGAFWVTKPGNPSSFDPSDVTGVQIGFVNGWLSTPSCVDRLRNTQGLPLPDNQVTYFDDVDSVVQALDDGSIGAGFIPKPLLDNSLMQPVSREISCQAGHIAVITGPTTEGAQFVKWWNEGLNRLLFSREYKHICERLETVHGHKEGPPKEDICLENYI